MGRRGRAVEKLVSPSLPAALETLKHRRVFVTGHTGFKGSWLCTWLSNLNCDIAGYSLAPPSTPAHYSHLEFKHIDIRADICDAKTLQNKLEQFQPEIVFHLAAQALVRSSYANPLATFAANAMGTATLLEACRQTDSPKAVVIVTSDKCYKNHEWYWSYRENDPLGGHDPYSASKGCAEIVAEAYRLSFFSPQFYGKSHNTLVASVRAGNVIGGGDWAKDRLVPDMMRAAAAKRTTLLRNPHAVRPWQHVLDPLGGYLLLAARLLQGESELARAWNFGPAAHDAVSVGELAQRAVALWPDIKLQLSEEQGPHEAGLLLVDASLARQKLGWRPAWSIDTALERTIGWYKSYYKEKQIKTRDDIAAYTQAIRAQQ